MKPVTVETTIQEIQSGKHLTGQNVKLPPSLNEVIEAYQDAYTEAFGKRPPNKGYLLCIMASAGSEAFLQRIEELKATKVLDKPAF
jgi:hypothetical protein